MKAVINIPYPGSVISVNHYKHKWYTKKECRAWMEELGWLVKQYHIETWLLPITVRCSGVFRDLRSCPDLSNLAKVCLDSLEEVSGVNDRGMRWHDGDITIDNNREPMLTLTITEGGADD